MINQEQPLVSICCLTYNHAAFVAECLEGFLMQQTNFGVEILVHDDASTDGTEEIIRSYAEKYPEKIFPLYEEENQYSKGLNVLMDYEYNYSRARGKYIAYCEGDDYWTDPLKLQKQIDFMESHPEYSVCFHRCTHLYAQTGKTEEDKCGEYFKNGEEGQDITLEMFFKSWITQPLTMVFRTSLFTLEWYKKYKYYRDMHEIYHLLNVGKGYLFGFNGGVYRYHSGGIHSMLSRRDFCNVSLPIDREFYQVSPSIYSKRVYCSTLQECFLLYAGESRRKALKYWLEYARVSEDWKRVIKFFWLIMKKGNVRQ